MFKVLLLCGICTMFGFCVGLTVKIAKFIKEDEEDEAE